MEKHCPPKHNSRAFHCPHCGVYSNQTWKIVITRQPRIEIIDDLDLSYCFYCKNKGIWFNKILIEPNIGGVPLPNSDMIEDIKIDYIEARDILNKSPRGAAALLRLAIQKLMKELGEKGENINTDIGELVRKGLSPQIQQALDVVRVIGNEAVHPGQIDLKDNKEIATQLFNLVNIIIDVMITQPKKVYNLYDGLPPGKKKAIDMRDKSDFEDVEEGE